MALELYWGSGSPYSWRVMLALEYKRLPYTSHLLQLSTQEHQSPQMLKLNFRGKVPVLKDDDYVCFESLAILYYLDRKFPDPPVFGRAPEESGVIMRVICEYQAYAEPALMKIVHAVLFGDRDAKDNPEAREERLAELTRAAHKVAGEARTIESRLSKSDWIVGESMSAADMVIYPDIQLLLRALNKPQAEELRSRFLPMDHYYPALARWMARVEAMPGYERTYPPHWRATQKS